MPLRGGKGWLYEGGIREPFIISHPKSIAPRVDHTAVCSVDFYRTLVDLTRIRNGKPVVNDGVSLSDLLRAEKPIKERDLYWHYPHYSNQGGFPGGAIRRGNYKLVERFEDGSFHLFDLENDIGERKDYQGRSSAASNFDA